MTYRAKCARRRELDRDVHEHRDFDACFIGPKWMLVRESAQVARRAKIRGARLRAFLALLAEERRLREQLRAEMLRADAIVWKNALDEALRDSGVSVWFDTGDAP